MFHLMLVFIPLVLIVILASILLFSIFSIVISIVGGTSTALFVKNKTYKKLLFIGFCILSFVGFLCLNPFIVAFLNLPANFLVIFTIVMLVCIIILSIVGIKLSNSIQNKIGRNVLIIIFCVILIIAISFVIFILIVSNI